MKLLSWIYQAVLTGLLVLFGNKGGVVPPSTPSADSGTGGRTASLVIIDDPMRPDRETLADRVAKDDAVDSFAFMLRGIHPMPWHDGDLIQYLRTGNKANIPHSPGGILGIDGMDEDDN